MLIISVRYIFHGMKSNQRKFVSFFLIISEFLRVPFTEYSIRSGLPGADPSIKPAELEVYVESAKNIPLVNDKSPSTYVRASVHHPKYGRKTGKTERIRNESNPIWRQTIVYDRIKLLELEEATLTLSIVHRHRARRKLLGEVHVIQKIIYFLKVKKSIF